MQVQLYDFRWTDESHCEFQAISEGRFGRKQIQIGDKISVQIVSDEVCCTGSVVDGVWAMCPERSSGRAKCPLCRSREKSFVYTVFDGFDTSNMTEADLLQIRHPHFVYVALFDAHLIKVGVSGEERKVLRQLEQGSHATLFIAHTPDGILARQIETLLRKNGIADKIKQTQKKEFICPNISDDQAETILQDTCKNLESILIDYENLKKLILSPPEFYSWANKYNLFAIEKSLKSFHSVELQKGEWISGRIMAIKGPFLIIETPDEIISVSVKDWLGKTLDFSDKPEGFETNEAFQRAFF